jgi:hypothetical protein
MARAQLEAEIRANTVKFVEQAVVNSNESLFELAMEQALLKD